jgi:hypothetical protein
MTLRKQLQRVVARLHQGQRQNAAVGLSDVGGI